MRKEYRLSDTALVALDTFDMPEGKVVCLSFYDTTGKMPGFTMGFPVTAWKDFQREVADYDPQS